MQLVVRVGWGVEGEGAEEEVAVAVAAHCAIARTSRRMVRQISVMGSR